MPPKTRATRYLGGLRRAISRLLGRLFKPAARYPADPRAVFILALSVFSGATAIALQAAPDSLNAVLPHWAVVLWGILLLLGSGMTLLGMLRQTDTGIITEQIGSVMVGATTVYYSIIAFWEIGAAALQNVGIILAWGIACFVRWGQLQALINATAEVLAAQRIEAEVVRRVAEETS